MYHRRFRFAQWSHHPFIVAMTQNLEQCLIDIEKYVRLIGYIDLIAIGVDERGSYVIYPVFHEAPIVAERLALIK